MTQTEQLQALAAFYKLHPIEYLQLLIDREYRRDIEAKAPFEDE